MLALLDRLIAVAPEAIPALAPTRAAFLEQAAHRLVEAAFRAPASLRDAEASLPLGSSDVAGAGLATVPRVAEGRCRSCFVTALRGFSPDAPPIAVEHLADLLVWSGAGVIGGALRGDATTPEETRRGLLAVWGGIVSGWEADRGVANL